MKDYIIRRLLLGLVTLLFISIIVFLLVRLSGDPVYLLLEPGAPQEDLDALRTRLGLDKPLIVQYGIFIANSLRGDFGTSIVYQTPTIDLFLERFPASLELALAAWAIAMISGVVIGVLSALRVGGFIDTFGKPFSFLGIAIPSFWLGLIMILVFAVELRVLPCSGRGGIEHLIMPALCMGWYLSATYLRLTRSSLLEVLGSDYIKFTRIKGLSEIMVVGKHALKNGMIPIITYAGVQLVLLVNGMVVIEIVFNWPGTGLLLYEGIMARDYPIVQTVILIEAVIMVVGALVVDILYGYIDPRIRLK